MSRDGNGFFALSLIVRQEELERSDEDNASLFPFYTL
jgi:hypothetical protein